MAQEVLLCSVRNCPNGEQEKLSSTVFYFLPKDLVMATKWTDALKKHLATQFTKILICSNHFEPACFETNSTKLKNNAVPTIYTPFKREKIDFTNTDIDEVKASSIKKLKLANLLPSLEINKPDNQKMDKEIPKKSTLHPVHTLSMEDSFDVKEDNKYVGDIGEENTSSHSLYNMEKIRELQMLQQNLEDEEKTLQKQEQDVDTELERLEEELKRKRATLKNLPNEEIEVLKKCFSKEQIRLLMKQISKARWTLDDLAMAYTISSLTSRDVYAYLRNDLRYPLPALSNISRCYKSKYRTKDKKK